MCCLGWRTKIELRNVGMFHFAAHAQHVEPAQDQEGGKYPPEKPSLLHKKDHSSSPAQERLAVLELALIAPTKVRLQAVAKYTIKSMYVIDIVE